MTFSITGSGVTAGAAISFPFSIDGSVTVAAPPGIPAPEEAVSQAVAAGLNRMRASHVKREGPFVLFTVRLLRFVMNTNLLVPIEAGAIRIEQEAGSVKLSYQLRTIRLLVMTIGAALAALVVSRSIGIATLAWLWLFGANYVITLVRFRWFVERCVRDGLEERERVPTSV